MNIIVKPYGSDLCYCRPDTTWERENRDFYSPECVYEIQWTPVVFARVCKAGKCVSAKFVERYYDGFGCGMLMYCGASTCVDHSSILPMPMYNPVVLENAENFEIARNSENCNILLNEAKAQLEEAICKASQLTSLRIGDYVAVELDSQKVLAVREDGEVAVKGRFCENGIFDFKIIF